MLVFELFSGATSAVFAFAKFLSSFYGAACPLPGAPRESGEPLSSTI
jgi:hypothetical protein